MKIDSHQHYWYYTREEYDWIDDSMTSIRRDFLPNDLLLEARSAGIDGAISVHARQTLEETRWLLSLAAEHSFICGVVGWVPLADPKVRDVLKGLAQGGSLKAVRHVLQGEPDDGYMLRADFNRGVSILREFGLAYDILVYERQLPHVIEFVKRHPQQIFVLDHIAKPRIRDCILSPSNANITRLAEFPNVACKISGMVTEADFKNWKEEDLKPYLDIALNAFGPERLLFGSDWPVCLAATTYGDWFAFVSRQIAKLSGSEQAAILGRTAARVYHLDLQSKLKQVPAESSFASDEQRR